MALFVHQLPNAGTYMLRGAQTLDRIVVSLQAGNALGFFVDHDRATVDTNHTPQYLSLQGPTTGDMFCSIELGIKFPAGTVFYAESMGAGNFAQLIFS